MENKLTVKNLLSRDDIKFRFNEILKEKSAGFMANLAVMVSNSDNLMKCEPVSVISAAVISASLELPLDPNLGFAAIIPYGKQAQFQIMYKGLIQLAQRSGQYKTIGVTEIYEGEMVSENRLTGEYIFDFTAKTSEKIIGYAAYFSLLNGFEKTVFWTIDQVKKHGKKYSQSFTNSNGRWNIDFDAMAKKTVLKNLIGKWGILSIQMQKAVIFDQSTPTTFTEEAQPEYIDNQNESINIDKINDKKEKDRFVEFINNAQTLDELGMIEQQAAEYGLTEIIEERKKLIISKNGK